MQNEKRKSFVVYTDYIEFTEELDENEMGEIFTAMLSYAAGKDIPEFSGRHVKAIFGVIRRQMDRDNEKYNEICSARREAGRKGGKARKAKKANAEQMQANQADNDNENDNDNDNDNVNVNENDNENDNENKNVNEAHALPPVSPRRGDAREKYEEDKNFMKFWSAYPKKSAPNEAYTVWQSVSPDKELAEKITSAVKRQSQCSQWNEDNGRYIPYPAKWLKARRWEEELHEETVMRDYSCILEHALNIRS